MISEAKETPYDQVLLSNNANVKISLNIESDKLNKKFNWYSRLLMESQPKRKCVCGQLTSSSRGSKRKNGGCQLNIQGNEEKGHSTDKARAWASDTEN